MKTLSKPKAPLIDTCPVFGVRVVRPGDSCAMPDSVRDEASSSTSSPVTSSPTVAFAIRAGVSAVTVTDSACPLTTSVTSCSTEPPSGTSACSTTGSKPSSESAIR
jgi:hypothetical protein